MMSSNTTEIKKIKFQKNSDFDMKSEWFGTNWPVVYIIHNHKEAYIGETTSVVNRMKQHMENKDRTRLTDIQVIAHKSFNKSAVLDIESKLIEYMSSDSLYKLQNSNSGMRNHDYYQKEQYQELFRTIWKKLKHQKIVKHDLDVLENSDLFKYTPYKNLTQEQYDVIFQLSTDFLYSVIKGEPASFIINGEAGTGKTVLAMYFMKLVTDKRIIDFISDGDELIYNQYASHFEYINNLKIALVVPMNSLRKTLKKVVSKVSGLKSSMVIGPTDVIKDSYDLLIVDESHRLSRRVNIVNYASFDKTNQILELGNDGTQLDWILINSNYQIFFYDRSQSIKPSDVRSDDFDALFEEINTYRYHIQSQLRSLGGNDYIEYVKALFSTTPPTHTKTFEPYEFKIFSSIKKMKEEITIKNNEIGLSRLIAGYAWEWKTKKLNYQQIKEQDAFDIEIQGEKLIWNKTATAWINSDNAINEVGSIHTTQGYDLNYAGIIIGPELKYNKIKKRIEVDATMYFDANGKRSILNKDELLSYITNIYKVLLSRAIKGTYLYVVDDELRIYLSQYIECI